MQTFSFIRVRQAALVSVDFRMSVRRTDETTDSGNAPTLPRGRE